MKSFILLICSLILVGCGGKEKDAKLVLEGVKEKKSIASEVIRKQDFSTENLLLAQEYFFDFSEKLHLLSVDTDSLKGLKSLMDKMGANSFCTTFILSSEDWNTLDRYCNSGSSYRCSYEMRDYKKLLEKFSVLIGTDYKAKLATERDCFI